MTLRLLHGHVVDQLATLEPESVHCCVTSPPYWGLRDYGTEPVDWPAIAYAPIAGMPACVEVPPMRCSLGLEPTIEGFIGHMVLVFRGVHRVMRADATAWVNMGDSYNTGTSAPSRENGRVQHGHWAKSDHLQRRRADVGTLKVKDMIGQPWRLALALQADGWWLRQDIVWAKRNPMPESVGDRCTKAHEYLFLLAKSERYYYDAEAIKEPSSPDTHARYARGRSDTHKNAGAALVPGKKPQTIAQGFEHMRKPVAGWAAGPGPHDTLTHAASPKYREAGEQHRTKSGLAASERKFKPRKLAESGSGTKANESFDAAMAVMPATRNLRSVWSLATEPYKEAHFATFPTELPRRCILAGSPAGGVVLDPFNGSGTTGQVALELGRQYVGIELKAEYLELTRRRLHGAQVGLPLGAAA